MYRKTVRTARTACTARAAPKHMHHVQCTIEGRTCPYLSNMTRQTNSCKSKQQSACPAMFCSTARTAERRRPSTSVMQWTME